jgi:hypothetical protein
MAFGDAKPMSIFDDLPPSRAPSKRYPQFITAFEKLVTEVQEKVRKSEGLQQPYTAVVEALDSLGLKNDTTVQLKEGCVSINIVALPEDTRVKLNTIADTIGSALLSKSLHKDGKPAYGEGSFWPSMSYVWKIPDRDQSVQVYVDLPSDGIADIRIETTDEITTLRRYKLVPRFDAGGMITKVEHVPYTISTGPHEVF